jgi:hypothetical protein
MSKQVKGIEIQGMDELVQMLNGMDDALSASVIRNVARKPASKVVSEARKLFPYRKTGVTKRTFGILKIQDKRQRFLEVGVKGKSLAWIFMMGAHERETKSGKETGSIQGIGNILWEAAASAQDVTKELAVNLNNVLKQYVRRKARKR